MSPQQDQFYIRAKLTFAEIIAFENKDLNGNDRIKFYKLAVAEVMIGLDVAINPKNISRYKFMVFNISVVFWRICNQFLRAGRAKHFTSEIGRIVAALEQQNDADKEWRIMYLSAAGLCFDDDKQTKPASDYIDKAIELYELLLGNTISSEEKSQAILKKCSEELDGIMNAFRKIEEREELLHKPKKIDPDVPEGDGLNNSNEFANLPPLDGLAAEGYDKVKQLLDESQSRKAIAESKFKADSDVKTNRLEGITKLYRQRIFVNQSDSKRFSGLPPVVKYLRTNTLVQLQCMTCGCIPEKEWEVTFNQLVKKLEETTSSISRNETLLDVCRTAWYLKNRVVAMKCFNIVQSTTVVSPILRIKLDMCEGIKMLSDLTDESINKSAKQRLSKKETEGFIASKKIDAIKLLERTLAICLSRMGDNVLSQEICVLIWNACIPLCQSHLRLKIHSALRAVATCLEAMSSPLLYMRMQVHFELSKCEEQSDFIEMAKEEGIKAILIDYGSLDKVNNGNDELDRNRVVDQIVKPEVNILDLRCSVFEGPSDVEGKLFLWIQQIKESKSKEFIADLITRLLFVMLQQLKAEQQNKPSGLPNDFALLLKNDNCLKIPILSIQEIQSALNIQRSGTGVVYNQFTDLLQQRLIIMSFVADMSHRVRNVNVFNHAASFILSFIWDPKDKLVESLIDQQISVHNMLADILLESINLIPSSSEDNSNRKSLGIKTLVPDEEIQLIKKMVIDTLEKGLQLSLSTNNFFAVQNSIIYFWNLHLHVFRYKLYDHVTTEFVEFLKLSISSIDLIKSAIVGKDLANTFDDRIKITISEVLGLYYEKQKQFPQAIDVVTKVCSMSCPEYLRRRVCELASRLTLVQAVGGGGKGGKGPPEPPKYDNIFLNVFSLIIQAEQPIELIPKEQASQLTDKAITAMTTELSTFLNALNWDDMTQERYSQVVEMQVECWSRLARLKIIFKDYIGAQTCAESCLNVISKEKMKKEDKKNLSSKVWRWISVCESLFGMTIASIIQPDGQEVPLQNQLRLLSLHHYTLSSDFALQAQNEELVLDASTKA